VITGIDHVHGLHREHDHYLTLGMFLAASYAKFQLTGALDHQLSYMIDRISVHARAVSHQRFNFTPDATEETRRRLTRPRPRLAGKDASQIVIEIRGPFEGIFFSLALVMLAQRYPDFYKPKPKSRNYVLHLRAWYAQAHPAEDFAETFAVWLQPRSRWRRRYKGWPALHKLEYIDELMTELAGTKPRNRARTKVEPLSEIRITLREHYRRKRERYDFDWPAVYDRDLRRIFSDDPRHRAKPTAASFIRSVRREVRQIVADGTGVHQYTIDHVIENMIDRCKDLKLRVAIPPREARRRLMIVLTVQVMNVLHSGYHRIAV